ncbi:cytochrome b [Paraburkholderia sprentiae WSM5005]|uniref:Cytochrome b n=1 Tax=Paraburkholderia sprentiae WSM5005 TaxID=754502 RepID=A0A1I9YEI8_9BURK|nr:cytochrome b [Paraburkholderia sprentiae]APA84721.1 cytochrome b [Paraburkholderia sprentiae WSM5005]
MTKLKHSSASATATRIAAGDDRTQYDAVSILLHWITVILVLAQFGLAHTWGFAPKPTRHLMIVGHMSFGIVLSAVLIVRIAWRLVPGRQSPAAGAGWVELAAKGVHYLLYALLIGEAVLGFALRWSGDESMSFFGLEIPAPFAPTSKATHHAIGEAHDLVGWAIIVIAAGHAAAALFHHYVLRDDVLKRMLPGKAGDA